MHIKKLVLLIVGGIAVLIIAIAIALVIPTYSLEVPDDSYTPQNRENFGSFSLSAAVRYPWNQSKMCSHCNIPTLMGVGA